MRNFTLSVPTKIYFGTDILEESLRSELENVSGNICAVVSGSLVRNGTAEKIIRIISSVNSVGQVYVFDKISPNPKLNEVSDCISFGCSNNVKAVVGIGGGSVIDAAKVVAAGIGCKYSAADMFDGKVSINDSVLPVIAIPSTAGTGTELSKAAIVSDTVRKIKTGIRSPYLFPKAAIVDPVLTYTVPKRITMETGFDVVAHAAESYISVMSDPFSEMLSREALKIAAENMFRLTEDINDHDAREKMSYASMIMGINLGNTGTALPHRMQYPVGASSDSSHGAGLAAMYPSWIYYSYKYSQEKFNEIGSLVSGRVCTRAEHVISAFEGLLEKADIKYHISDFGFNQSDCDKLADQVSGSIQNDPASKEKDIIRKIYIRSL